MSRLKKQPNKQDQNNRRQHQQQPQQQKTRQEYAPGKLRNVSEYHDQERIETRLTR